MTRHGLSYNRLIDPFLPPGAGTLAATGLTLSAEFFLELAGDTGEMSGITKGVCTSEVKVRKAIVL